MTVSQVPASANGNQDGNPQSMVEVLDDLLASWEAHYWTEAAAVREAIKAGRLRRGAFPLGNLNGPAKGEPCVYLLMLGSEVVYVGYSLNVRARLRSHWDRWRRKGEREVDGWVIVLCDTPKAAFGLEGDLIFQHRPRYNVADTHRRRVVI